MIEIQVSGLIKSFEVGHNVLDGLTFQIDQGERVGLLGKNGAGKTTLFKILTGEMDYDEGQVMVGQGRRVGLISQIPVYPEGYTVEDVLRSAFSRVQKLAEEMAQLEARMAAGESDGEILRRYGSLSERFEMFGGYDTDVAVNKIANGLSISKEQRRQLFDSLSGGEKTRVNLGRLILEDTDILLLDEPTNHLDLHATEWLEEYIRSFRGTVVAISHDRYFLDRIVTRVIEIEDGKAEFYSGNYSFYAVEKERRFQERMKQYEKEQAKIEQLERASEQLRLWAFKGMDKTYRRAISMERRIERMRTTSKPTKARKMDARFNTAEFHGDEVLALRNLAKSYGEKHLFDGITLKVEGSERIALIGDNGTGKSTLIKMIMDEIYPDEGRIRTGPQVKAAYLPQIIHFDHPDWNLVENMMAAKKGLSAQSARNRLAGYDFRGEDVFKPVSVLSGGEQSRLRLCMLMDDEINFLILDEPTNHLDIASREWIEEAVEAYDGTLLFVSHDRYFINRFATRIWELEGGTITDYPMGFTQYRQVKSQEEAEKVEEPKPVKEKPAAERPQRGNKAQQAARRQLTICQREIEKLEEAIAAKEAEMEANACDYEKYGALYAEKEAMDEQLLELMEKWEKLAEEAESKCEKLEAVPRETGILIAAAALVLLGIVFFSVSGMMFLGYLAVEAAGVCIVWIFLCRWAKKSRAGRLCRNAVLVVLCLGILLFCIMESIIVSHGEWDNEPFPADAVIVLGAGVNGEEPSPALQTRLNAAQSYMEQHPDIPVVLSGGLGIGETVAEAEVMCRALSTGEKGWDSRLLKEPRATSTAENFRYACEVLRQAGMEPEEMRIAFVTNDFHIYRAKLIAERMGLQAFGVPAELPWWWVNLTCYVREAFALVKTMIFD